jgi:hypothetical protein
VLKTFSKNQYKIISKSLSLLFGKGFFMKVPIFLGVLPFVFRPEAPSGFDLLSSPDDFALVISSRRYAPG